MGNISSAVLIESDALLAQQARQGDRSAFRKLVERYQNPIYNLAFRMCGNATMAEEVAQEVFVKVFQNLEQFKADGNFRSWVLKIASNTCISQFRKDSNPGQPVLSLDALQSDQGDTIAPPDPQDGGGLYNPLDNRLDNANRILSALNQLDYSYRMAILLRYYEEYSYEEIATTMGVPINTVRTWLKRGKDILKRILEDKDAPKKN